MMNNDQELIHLQKIYTTPDVIEQYHKTIRLELTFLKNFVRMLFCLKQKIVDILVKIIYHIE